jgi:hypothetical protein
MTDNLHFGAFTVAHLAHYFNVYFSQKCTCVLIFTSHSVAFKSWPFFGDAELYNNDCELMVKQNGVVLELTSNLTCISGSKIIPNCCVYLYNYTQKHSFNVLGTCLAHKSLCLI